MKNHFSITLYFILILSLLANSLVFGQSLNLNQAVEYGLAHNETIRNLQLDKAISLENVKATQSKYYPTINGLGDFKNNIILPTQILPAGIFGPESRALQFGQRYNTTLALDANLVLFDPTLYAQVKSQQINALSIENNVLAAKRDLILAIKKAYYSAIINQKKIVLYANTISKAKTLLSQATVLGANQLNVSLDIEKAKYTLRNQEIEKTKAVQALNQSLYVLKYNMGFPIDSSLTLSDSLIFTSFIPSALDAQPIDYSNKISVKNALLAREQEVWNVKKAKAAFLPTFSLYGYLGTQHISSTLDFSKNWYGLAYVGAKINIPIFDGWSKSRLVSISKLTQTKKQNDIDFQKRQAAYESNFYDIQLKNAKENVDLRKNQWDLALAQKNQVENKYNTGLVVLKEVLDANTQSLEAEINYYVTIQEYLNALLEKEKADEKVVIP